MPKGPKPPKLPPKPTPSDPLPPELPPMKCWIFTPIEQTPIAQELKTGDKTYGTFQGSKVHVNSEKGAVGYVPNSEAEEMIRLSKETNKRLLGQVISNEGFNLLVELCLL